MARDESIQQALVNKFGSVLFDVRLPRPRRIFLSTDTVHFMEVFEYIVKELKFPHLCMITGLDDKENLSFIYHLASEDGILVNLKISVPRENPILKTVIHHFVGAEIYEREVVDLFGAKVEGLPPGHRYPLIDNWPEGQYPLRKDWKPATSQVTEESKETPNA